MIEIPDKISKFIAGHDSFASALMGQHNASTMVSVVHKLLVEGGLGKLIHRDEKNELISVRNGLIHTHINGEELEASIYAHNSENLHVLRELISHFAEEHLSLPELDWTDSDDVDVGSLPPNCRIAKVVGVERYGQQFIRVTLSAEKLDRYTHVGLHFRIGIPPSERKPVWPTLSKNGRTVWAKGEDKLHLPAYTTVSVDLKRNELVFDLFAHHNGPACAWAEGLFRGTESREEILLSGPGGGWIPPTKKLLIAGDETALPAIRRTLATVKTSDDIIAFIELENLLDIKSIAVKCERYVTFLDRSRGESLSKAVSALEDNQLEDRYLWFAGEKVDADNVREKANSNWDIPKKQRYVAAYWKR